MGYSSDDRRRMNKEMWDRDNPIITVPHIEEHNDYRIDDVFKVQIMGDDIQMSCGHVNKPHLLRMIEEEFEHWHSNGATIVITPNGRI